MKNLKAATAKYEKAKSDMVAAHRGLITALVEAKETGVPMTELAATSGLSYPTVAKLTTMELSP
jgi:hypothetical protein|tara:strand:- start:416 stop:607 length:192 start_codon:yes stop_codon:yes gene_type:complete